MGVLSSFLYLVAAQLTLLYEFQSKFFWKLDPSETQTLHPSGALHIDLHIHSHLRQAEVGVRVEVGSISVE